MKWALTTEEKEALKVGDQYTINVVDGQLGIYHKPYFKHVATVYQINPGINSDTIMVKCSCGGGWGWPRHKLAKNEPDIDILKRLNETQKESIEWFQNREKELEGEIANLEERITWYKRDYRRLQEEARVLADKLREIQELAKF